MALKRKKSAKKRVKRKVVKRRVAKKRAPPKRRALKKRAAPKRRALKKKPAALKPKEKGKVVGIVTHYFPHVRAGVIKLKAPLAVGDMIKVKGHTTDFTQAVSSMQIDRVPIKQGKKGQEIGLLVDSRARQHDVVYKVK